MDWLSRVKFLGIGRRAQSYQHELYQSLVDHSGFYKAYIHQIIAEERYDSGDESSDSFSSSEKEVLDLDWAAYSFIRPDPETLFL